MPVDLVATPLTISQLASQVDVRPDTVRYYERIGLLSPPPRTSGDHRRYDAAALDRLRFIKGAQRLSLELTEIADLLAVRDTGACPCEPAEELLRRHVAEIDTEIARLTALRSDLTTMLDGIPGPRCPEPTPGTWRPSPHPARR